ncbi:LDL, Prenyltransferase and alpha-2-macroglobulin domain-containing protein [Sarcoptes scabiei]|uniref:LDL, Prenyltransferase and alpha-2-macroglobulin domain-containing protein n=1 Tax=Sarcoptes scabiei TaxID=52283 RepID=A0A132A171_SARSC|nr:LDL, Prenyltransferase and alpha-2-macroglobulin domain-containing protein [Sarcoptes scabiei]
MPNTALPGDYKLWIEGNVNEYFGGNVFHNESRLEFVQRFMTIFITTDKPVYMQGQTVRFRAMPIQTDLKSFSDAIDIYMLDPRGIIMRRWLSRQTNLGAVSLDYPLSQQPVYGQNWTIRVVAQGQFYGYYEFRRSLTEIRSMLGTDLDGALLTVTAYVGERFLNLIFSGFAKAYIIKSRTKIRFLGANPQVFKPSMMFKAYAVVYHEDGSPIRRDRLYTDRIEVSIRVNFKNGQSRSLKNEEIPMSQTDYGVWEIKVNLRKEFLNQERLLRDVNFITIEAFFKDVDGVTVKTKELRAYAAHSPSQRLVQVSTSTMKPTVGQYIIFHVRTNYYLNLFNYVVMSKGIILVAGREEMNSMLKTFTFTVTSEMAPSSTILVYDIAPNGEVITDSLTFSVDGISRNNFTVELNNLKDKTGDTIEVVVYAQPGTYIGLSALDKDSFAVDADNQLNYAMVQSKMSTFDDVLPVNNASLSHSWYSSFGLLNKFLHFPTPSIGIDSNQTFENIGLIVFTDATITQRPNLCNKTRGLLQCMDGTCYQNIKRCDGRSDCRDGTDESNCPEKDSFELESFFSTRTNRLQRLYENSWLWNDINIGPLGYHIFKLPVPNAPVNWIISSFGMSKSHGFGIQKSRIQYSSVRPFYMNVEMPTSCLLGEQIGIRISIFNYLPYEIEVVVILARSPHYKFVHVESFGRVQSYNPRTSFGQHQHLIMIYPSQTKVVYMPIVAQRIGDINITVMAQTQVAKDIVTKTIRVEPDGVPQYTHTSLVLDLSQGAYLIKYLETNVTENPIIPYRKERRYVFGSNRASITVVGDVVGPAFPTIPMNTTSMLRKPFDAAEPSMFSFAVNVYILLYLRYTGQRKPNIENEIFKYLNIDYQRQLSYQNADGSFRAFRWHRTPSIWMTAFCARILHLSTFQEWENFLYVDPKVIQNAIDWLLKQQQSDGSFQEFAQQSSLNRRTNRTSVSLTAHVLITLAEVRDLSGDVESRATSARTSAQRFLERALHMVKDYEDPYELAIVTYALTLVESVEAVDGFNALYLRMREVSGMRYWGKEPVAPIRTQVESNRPFIMPRLPNRYDSSNVATTAYGLLIHIKRQAFIQKEIVDWLNTQRLYDSGWSTTEDTIVALQALIDYSNKDRLRDVTDITITIEAPASHNFSSMLHISEENISKMQSVNIPNAFGAVTIKAQGSGVAIVQLNVEYCVDWQQFQIQPPIRSFDLDVMAVYTGRNSSHITFRSCQRWINIKESLTSGMTVLEVTIPTGYFIQQQDLDLMVRTSSINNLKEARFSNRKVVFYFDYLDTSFTCISFTVQRWFPVANLTRYIPIKVYDYYAPGK